MPLYVSVTVVPYSLIDFERFSRSILPSRIAVDISAAPFFPNNSVAICNASVSVLASFILPIVLLRASSIERPSAVAFCKAFLSPASAAVESTPFSSNCAINSMDCSNDNPISLNVALLSRTYFSNVSTEIPVACAFDVSNPNRFPVSAESMFHAFIILSTLSTDFVTSVPLIFAN